MHITLSGWCRIMLYVSMYVMLSVELNLVSVVLNNGLIVFVVVCDEIGIILGSVDDIVAECKFLNFIQYFVSNNINIIASEIEY